MLHTCLAAARSGLVLLVLAVSCLSTAPAAGQFFGPVVAQHYLNVPYDRQETGVWCWVAVARMVARYYNVDVPGQCEMLQTQYGAPCCGSPLLCTRAGHIDEVRALIAAFGLRASAVGPPANGYALYEIFQAGHPVVLYVDNSHFVVATGMRVERSPIYGDVGIVRILDPMIGQHDVPLPQLYQRWGAAIYVY